MSLLASHEGGSQPEPNIVITGFMGSGKSSVGRYLAARLERPFLDLDACIADRAGQTIPEIFARAGEPAFRALEHAACQELRDPAGLVVATGGGTVTDPANLEALLAGGQVVCLDASIDAILQRLATAADRPLLAGPDRRSQVEQLLSARAAAYAAVPRHIDTTSLSIPAVGEQILGMLSGLPQGGHRLVLRPGGAPGYDILIAHGLLADAGQRIQAAGLNPGRCALVTNPTVAKHYAQSLSAALERAGFEPLVFEIPDGEVFKTHETAARLYGDFADAHLARGEPVIALGGGVVGDVAGFIAATWLRGVPFVQAPTTLLAMADASVGGKVGIDLPQGKNLVGAFLQPALVLVDPSVLATLPEAERRAGMAEVVKAAIVGDPEFFDALAHGDMSLVEMLAAAVRVKAGIVERDPFEAGGRAYLNLGHTFGHALEVVSGYKLRHGEAVALGLIAAAELSVLVTACAPSVAREIRSLVAELELPTSCAFDPDAVIRAMGADKKRRGQALRFVVIERIGSVRLMEGISEANIRTAMEAIQQR